MKQIKIIEAKSREDLEKQLNEVYSDCNINNYHIIGVKMLHSTPRTVQVIFDVPEGGKKE